MPRKLQNEKQYERTAVHCPRRKFAMIQLAVCGKMQEESLCRCESIGCDWVASDASISEWAMLRQRRKRKGVRMDALCYEETLEPNISRGEDTAI